MKNNEKKAAFSSDGDILPEKLDLPIIPHFYMLIGWDKKDLEKLNKIGYFPKTVKVNSY